MSGRNWKSSSTRRRTAIESGSIYGSSSSSTFSATNKTIGTNESRSIPISTAASPNGIVSDNPINVQTEGVEEFPNMVNNHPVEENIVNDETNSMFSFDDRPTKYVPSNLDSNASVVSALSSASSVDTYDFAFKLSSQKSIPGKRPRGKKTTDKFAMQLMPTVEEANPNPDTNFLDSILSLGGEEYEKEHPPAFGSNGMNGYGKASIYVQQSVHKVRIAVSVFKRLFARLVHATKLKMQLNQQKQHHQNGGVPLHSSKYSKQKSFFSSWIFSLLKLFLFASLIITSLMALRLANQNQPDLLDPYARNSGSKSLKQKLIRRRRYPGVVRPGQITFPSSQQQNNNNNNNQNYMETNNVEMMDPMNQQQLQHLEGQELIPPQGQQQQQFLQQQHQHQQEQQQFPNQMQILEPHHFGGNPHSRHMGVRIPTPFLNLADIDELPVLRGQDLPLYWHIPRTGGTMMNDVLGSCIHLNLAANAGGMNGHDKDEELQVLNLGPIKYVNVDMSTPTGIERAKKLELASSNQADAMISSLVYESSLIFTPINHGRLFTLFRHPIDRAVSLFYYTQDMIWRRGNVKDLMDITIEEYFKGGMGENNWMTRFLANARNKVLTDEDLDVAKEVLRRKCLVGLLTEKGESMSRFFQYFGWDENIRGEREQDCIDKKLDYAWPQKHRHEDVEEGSEAYDLIVQMNTFDLQLFEYAKILFKEQSRLFGH